MPNYGEETVLQLWNPAISYEKQPPLPIPRGGKRPKAGSFDHDHRDKTFNMLWPTLEVFELWKKHTEEQSSIRWVVASRKTGTLYLQAINYVCNRNETGGPKIYKKKHPERVRKIPNRKLDEGCPATLFVKTYPATTTILGSYVSRHSHELGENNIRFIPLSDDSKLGIIAMAMQERSTEHIVRQVKNGTFNLLAPNEKIILREQLVTRRTVQYYAAKVRATRERLHQDDGISAAEWAKSLGAKGSLLYFKGVGDAAQPESLIPQDAFVMIFQSSWQREVWASTGGNYFGTDGTHNVTQYQNLNLYSILARDEFGRGIPVAFMLASSGDEATHKLFFKVFRQANPTLPPYIIMDRDLAAFNAARTVYPEIKVLLCWFHLISAWWKHINVPKNPSTWKLLLALPRAKTQPEFDTIWSKIKDEAPLRFIAYMEKYWVLEPFLSAWSGVHRQNRAILQQQDTTNIVESYHHTLKCTFFGGFRNRRVDVVIHTLVERVEDYYKTRRLRQKLGFEGGNVEEMTLRRIKVKALMIPDSDIKKDVLQESLQDEGIIYCVASQTSPGSSYLLDISANVCSCLLFELGGVRWCKHLEATARVHYGLDSGAGASVEDSSWGRSHGNDSNSASSTEEPQTATPGSSTSMSSSPDDAREEEEDDAGDVWWASVAPKLLLLATMSPSNPVDLDETIKMEFSQLLDRLILQALPKKVTLPKKTSVPPNIKSTTETISILPQGKKKAVKTAHGPYSMGEASGKKAREVKTPPAPPLTAPPPTSNSMTSSVDLSRTRYASTLPPPLLCDNRLSNPSSNSRAPATLPISLRHAVSAPSLVQRYQHIGDQYSYSEPFPSTSFPSPYESNPSSHSFQLPVPRPRSLSYQGAHQAYSAAAHPHVPVNSLSQANSRRYHPYPSPHAHAIPNHNPTTLLHHNNQPMVVRSSTYDPTPTPYGS